MSFACRPNLGGSPTYSGTITLGTDGIVAGYSGPSSVGSISPSTLSDGNSINSWYDSVGSNSSLITIAGLSADPGINYLGTSITANGVTKSPASVGGPNYSYNSGTGTAAWVFVGKFGFATSGTAAASIP